MSASERRSALVGVSLLDEGVVRDTVRQYVGEVREVLAHFPFAEAEGVVHEVVRALSAQRTVWVAGNGGSAASASHLAHDCAAAAVASSARPVSFVGMADNSARITAIANDMDYSEIFAEQLRQGGEPGDLLLAISVSGSSANVLRAAAVARSKGMRVAALVGRPGGLSAISDVTVNLDVVDYGVAEDLHLMFNHMLVRVLRGGAHVLVLDQARADEYGNPRVDQR